MVDDPVHHGKVGDEGYNPHLTTIRIIRPPALSKNGVNMTKPWMYIPAGTGCEANK